MATVYVTLGGVVTRDVFDGDQVRSETITSSGASATGALLAADGEIAQVVCASPVYARSGGTAAPANSAYCAVGTPQFIRMTAGDAVSVIDV